MKLRVAKRIWKNGCKRWVRLGKPESSIKTNHKQSTWMRMCDKLTIDETSRIFAKVTKNG